MTTKDLAAAAYQQDRLVDDYIYLKHFSTVDRAVYQHRRTKKVTIAFRGTNPTNWRDVTTDALMGFGMGSWGSRFKNAREITKKVIDTYGKENVTVTGHSLGGSQALHVSQRYGVKAEVYNPFVHPSETILSLGPRPAKGFKDATVHVNVTDPVAMFVPIITRTGKTKYHYDVKRLPSIGQHGLNHKPPQTGRGQIALTA